MDYKINWLITPIALVFISSINCTSAQGIDKNDVFKTWHLFNYKVESKTYAPRQKEKNDYILFKQDMTFESLSEGKKEKGTWSMNNNGGYIIITDNNGERVKAYILSLTSKILILQFDIEEIKEVEVHYISNS